MFINEIYWGLWGKKSIYLPFRSFTQYWAFLTALEKKNRKKKTKDNKSDRNGAYEGKVIKVSINVWNCIFKSSQRIGQCYIPSEFVPFWNCPWVEGIFCSNPLWLLAVCKSTLWNKLSKNGQLIVDWHLCERLVCVAFYRREGGGHLAIFLGGYVPPGTPNWHPILKKISPKINPAF